MVTVIAYGISDKPRDLVEKLFSEIFKVVGRTRNIERRNFLFFAPAESHNFGEKGVSIFIEDLPLVDCEDWRQSHFGYWCEGCRFLCVGDFFRPKIIAEKVGKKAKEIFPNLPISVRVTDMDPDRLNGYWES